jgi:hypothetical protein
MKTAITSVLMLALVIVYGCQSSSPQGGGVTKDVGFKIAVPTFSTEIKQGEIQSVTISLVRGAYFKQDVRFLLKTTEGISVNPTFVLVKASDKPDVQFRIEAAKSAALGEYVVTVTGNPTTGEPASTQFNVKVVSP